MIELNAVHISHEKLYLGDIAKIHREVFPNDAKDYEQSVKWIRGEKSALENGKAYYFAITDSEKLVGYILWKHIGGFRNVIELEQIGVSKDYQGQGLGTKLIDESIRSIELYVRDEVGEGISKVRVTTGTSNRAQELYSKTLGAELQSIEPLLFDGDEAIMHATRENINKARKNRNLPTLDDIVKD